MLSEFKSRTGLEWGEITSILILVSVGVPFLYKVGFYNELGIGWYINTGNAFSIFVSSVSIIFFGIFGLILGCVTFLGIKEIKTLRYSVPLILITVIILFLMALLLFTELALYLKKVDFTGIVLTLTMYSLVISFLTANDALNEGEGRSDKRIIAYGAIIIIAYAFLSWSYGQSEAQNILKYKHDNLNIVDLKGESEKWFLVDYTGDKALIIKDGSKSIFRIVEYKDLKQISPPEKK